MKLQEVFDLLSSGELSQISVGGQEQGEINENNWAKVIGHINLGLSALYRRFNLKEGKALLQLVRDQEYYLLNSRFAKTNRKSRVPETDRYILDTVSNPFEDVVNKVEKITVEGGGGTLPLNDPLDPLSIQTPTTTALEVPLVIVNQSVSDERFRGDRLQITFRAAHPKIVVPLGYFDPARVELELPDAYLQALLFFVASRAHTPIGIPQEGVAGHNWYRMYENECARLEMENLQRDEVGSNHRMVGKGWV